MKQRFGLVHRPWGVFYIKDKTTGAQTSLKTRDRMEAKRLLQARNEAEVQPALNRQIAQAYLSATDPEACSRTWQDVMDISGQSKHGSTLARWKAAMKDQAFDSIRDIPLLETRPEQFLAVLKKGTVATNVFLRRVHHFALAMAWVPKPVVPRKQWPAIVYKVKRSITAEEHQRIMAIERNAEWRAYYELLWNVGGSQTDVAQLRAEDVDWSLRVISFQRHKTGSLVQLHFGEQLATLLRLLPQSGPLLPRIGAMTENNRAKVFTRRRNRLNISGVSLHSYRYAWAERAKMCGYPERFAQQALGHASKAVHRAYARKAQVKLPSLEEYETVQASKMVKLELPAEQPVPLANAG